MPKVTGLSHVVLHVRDMDKMVAFYRDVVGLTINQGQRPTSGLIFLTANPETDDHEIAFVRGRDGDAKILNHIAFRVPTPADVKTYYDQFIATGVPIDHTVSHSYVTQGNTVSCYFLDPEGNRLEVYAVVPDRDETDLRNRPLDLDQTLDEILRQAGSLGANGAVVGHAPEVRARIGLIIPTSNRLSEEQFHRYAPTGVHVHTTRLRMTGPNRIAPADLPREIIAAAETLADAKCDVIVFHCTGSSMEAGFEGEKRIIADMAAATGRRTTSTASAIVEALHAIAADRLALISPYASNEHEVNFLHAAGFEVVVDRAMNLSGSDAFVSTPSAFWLEATEKAADPRVDAFLLSCTNIRSPEVVEELERRLARPVITSNQATLWYCLRACGLSDVIPGLGRLFQLGLPAAVTA
jgi:maleate isomerase